MTDKNHLELRISGMHCASCAAAIEKGLARMEGISRCQVNYATGTAAVEYHREHLDEPRIISRIEELGYSAHSHSAGLDPLEYEAPAARKAFLVSLILTLPVMIFSMWGPTQGVGLKIRGTALALLTLPVLFFAGREIFSDAWKQTRRFSSNMNSLIALGSLAAYIYSLSMVLAVWGGWLHHEPHFYFETAAMIVMLILLGRYLESRAKDKARDSIGALLRLRPEKAIRVIDGREEEISVAEVEKGMILAVRPGDKIPADGEIVEGSSAVNEAMITGESLPVAKKPGDNIIGGSVNGQGALKFRVTGAGEETFLAGIIRLVSQAQNRKAPVQKLADKIAGVFVPIILGLAVLTFIIWLVFDRHSSMLFTAPVAVLIIACPCALGLATPTAILAGTGKAARKGIFIRGGDILETADKASHILFDKTGTLTQGKFEVIAVRTAESVPTEKLLALAGSVEAGSSHPLALAIVEKARSEGIDFLQVQDLVENPGSGVMANIGGARILVGNLAEMESSGIDFGPLAAAAREEMSRGKTVVFAAADKQPLGYFALADQIRPEVPEVITALAQSGRELVMITGDNYETARGVAENLGLTKFEADIKPDKKALVVETFRRAGNIVMMVGDGINDAPALAAANVGVALGSGTDVAMESADIILVRSDMNALKEALDISRATYRTIKQNLFWAFFYNMLAVPLAAGILYPVFGWSLSPMIAAAAMACSSLFVVTNSLRLLRG